MESKSIRFWHKSLLIKNLLEEHIVCAEYYACICTDAQTKVMHNASSYTGQHSPGYHESG